MWRLPPCTFISAGHPLYWSFVVVVLTYWKCEDAHLWAEESELKQNKKADISWKAKAAVLCSLNRLCLQSYRLIGIVFFKDLLRLLFSSVSEEHDNLVTVGPWHIHLRETKVKRLSLRQRKWITTHSYCKIRKWQVKHELQICNVHKQPEEVNIHSLFIRTPLGLRCQLVLCSIIIFIIVWNW